MPTSDVFLVFQWWSSLFLIGVAAFPLTKRLFGSWFDQGYALSKAVGLAVVTYTLYLGGTLHILPFSVFSIYGTLIVLFVIGILSQIFNPQFSRLHHYVKHGGQAIYNKITNSKSQITLRLRSGQANFKWKKIGIWILEELLFFGVLLFWSWVKGHEPSIRGLEKFMDFGFMQSILNTRYFPASDMWYAGGTINYYYFGHIVTAVLTKLSGIDLSISFNLMLATLCAFTFTMSMGIGIELQRLFHNPVKIIDRVTKIRFLVAGLLTGFLTTFAGNMQTIYAFTKGYTGENVVPFWTILWPAGEFFSNFSEGLNRYWYANATRFIPFTIHEFPSYSFVVSDVHGHVLSIPFVLLTIAVLITLFCRSFDSGKLPSASWRTNNKLQTIFQISNSCLPAGKVKFPSFALWAVAGKQTVFYGFLMGILLMTNALDGPIYFGLIAILFFFMMKRTFHESFFTALYHSIAPLFLVGIILTVTALPFLIHFDSFATGIGVNCPPAFLANSRFGPILFEGIEKCQASPLWMMWLLWGFFWFCGFWLFIPSMWREEERTSPVIHIVRIFFIFSIGLIIFPEFFYVKDIYPAHFRSNTMFKLGYQAFIMWSILSGFVITHFVFLKNSSQITLRLRSGLANYIQNIRILFFLLLIPQLFLVSIYPYFSVRSYFGELRIYKELYGLSFLTEEFPDDFAVLTWMKTQPDRSSWVILEADGDSYTDYNHMSAFSGVPSVVGWAVHEWLWRGGYDVVSPRRDDVRAIYEGTDRETVRSLLKKYRVTHILVGRLEREKFKNLNEQILTSLGHKVFIGGSMFYEVLSEL